MPTDRWHAEHCMPTDRWHAALYQKHVVTGRALIESVTVPGGSGAHHQGAWISSVWGEWTQVAIIALSELPQHVLFEFSGFHSSGQFFDFS